MRNSTTALEYLAELIAAYRERTPAFSFRWLAERCHLKSPNYIQQVLAGKKGLSSALAGRICSAIRATDEQRETLLLLSKRDESLDPRVRALIDVRLDAMTFDQTAIPLRPQDLGLFQAWFAPLLWVFSNGRTRAEVSRLFPSICASLVSPRDADRVLADLVRSDMLTESPDGVLEIQAEVLAGKTQISPSALRSFYQSCATATRKLLALQEMNDSDAVQSLSRVTTFSVDPAYRDAIGKRISAFHKELISEFGLNGAAALRAGELAQVSTFAHQFRCPALAAEPLEE